MPPQHVPHHPEGLDWQVLGAQEDELRTDVSEVLGLRAQGILEQLQHRRHQVLTPCTVHRRDQCHDAAQTRFLQTFCARRRVLAVEVEGPGTWGRTNEEVQPDVRVRHSIHRHHQEAQVHKRLRSVGPALPVALKTWIWHFEGIHEISGRFSHVVGSQWTQAEGAGKDKNDGRTRKRRGTPEGPPCATPSVTGDILAVRFLNHPRLLVVPNEAAEELRHPPPRLGSGRAAGRAGAP
mmetsp:Transcript_93154/g.268069  ORF Transcript_93154/g.268069 Transcript_93154/m.268069 type:complete len:236 (+) Transcript_93154:757-1464(+)